MPTALITGIAGQDGLYLVSYLLFRNTDYDYEVHGIVRKGSVNLHILIEVQQYVNSLPKNEDRRKLVLHYGDMCDSSFILTVVNKSKPDELYNFAA